MARRRWIDGATLAGRVVLAAGGGYAVAALSTVLLSLSLPLVRSEAVAAATIASFAILLAVVVTVFALRSLLRAVVVVTAIALALGAGCWLARDLAAPVDRAAVPGGGAP